METEDETACAVDTSAGDVMRKVPLKSVSAAIEKLKACRRRSGNISVF